MNQLLQVLKTLEIKVKGKKKNHYSAFAVIMMIVLSSFSASAVTYYSRTNGNWNAATSWSTVTYGNATNTGTFPQAGDVVNIGNGHTITISSSANCATLNVGQGVSGRLAYSSVANYTLNVTGNVTVNVGATISYSIAVARTHQLVINGNLSNFGTVDLFLASGQVVNLIFFGATTSNVSGTGTFDLNTVTMNKSTQATQLNILSNTFESAIRTFAGTMGTYVHNNTTSYSINPIAAAFTISQNCIYQVPLGTMWFGSATDNVVLQGGLVVNGGTVLIGSTAGIQGLRTDKNGIYVPSLTVSSGSLTIHGGITTGATSGSEPFNFNMSGGLITLNTGTTGTNRQVFLVNDVAGSSFTMSGGTIRLQRPNIAGSVVTDFMICGNSGTVSTTGGTVEFGNASTAAGVTFSFRPFASATYPHMRITGAAANTGTLAPSNGSTANFNFLSLYIDNNKTFDIRSFGGALGDTKTMTLLSTVNGVDALYNMGTFTARQSTVTFNTTGAQAIGGTQTTSFYNLSINNASNITLNRPANVSNYLSMVNGKLMTTNTNVLTCQSAANANMGSTTSYVDGPMIHTVATASASSKNYPIGKANAYRPIVLSVTHSNSLSITYRGEIFNSPASTLPFSLPPSISAVSNVRYARFTRTNISNFVSGQITMYYNIDDGVADKNTLLVAHDNGTVAWQNYGGTATANWNGSITSGVFNSFNSYFALGNPPGGGNPLPIDLSSFTAELKGKQVFVNWATETEVNNDHFTIERSTDNINFGKLGTVNGAGNSSHRNTYSFIDENPLPGISYYRLKQTDYDGTTETFNSVVINNKENKGFVVYPNPAVNSTVQLKGDDRLKYCTITMQDITGKVVKTSTSINENGTVSLTFEETLLQTGGVFIITATDGSDRMRQKLVVNQR